MAEAKPAAPYLGQPLLFPAGGGDHRVYLNEDDYSVPRFSTRSGDWAGNVRTIDFSNGGSQLVHTRVDGNNHAILSSDRVFSNSGIRRINTSSLYATTGGGALTRTLAAGGLWWEVSRMFVYL